MNAMFTEYALTFGPSKFVNNGNNVNLISFTFSWSQKITLIEQKMNEMKMN